jgi:hypothetical protein
MGECRSEGDSQETELYTDFTRMTESAIFRRTAPKSPNKPNFRQPILGELSGHWRLCEKRPSKESPSARR